MKLTRTPVIRILDTVEDEEEGGEEEEEEEEESLFRADAVRRRQVYSGLPQRTRRSPSAGYQNRLTLSSMHAA